VIGDFACQGGVRLGQFGSPLGYPLLDQDASPGDEEEEGPNSW